MTLQAISKGFEYYKKFGLSFTIKIFPLIFLFGFIASIGSSSSLSDGISNFDILLLLINNFLISPLLTIISIFIANDLIEKNNRDVLVDSYFGSAPWFPLLLLSIGIFFTFYLGFPQLKYFYSGWKILFTSGSGNQGQTSPFQALSTALSGTVGTGNIGGVAMAIFIGGPAA